MPSSDTQGNKKTKIDEATEQPVPVWEKDPGSDKRMDKDVLERLKKQSEDE